MVQYKCRSCGGEMEFGGSGSFICPYCGAKTFMTDADFRGSEEFRKRLLAYGKAKAESMENDYSADSLWTCEGHDVFVMSNGQQLTINYMTKYEENGYRGYLARENVIFVFDDAESARNYLNGLGRLSFPEADNKLRRCFPSIKTQLGLKDGREVIVFVRNPNFYPAEMFSPWPSEHLAWVISRMENICCELEFSGITHGDITPSSVWINPVSHEGMLFGDWRKVHPRNGNEDLISLRRTAIELAKNAHEPLGLYEFLNSEPSDSAFEDFSRWDLVIQEDFGGHRFIKML